MKIGCGLPEQAEAYREAGPDVLAPFPCLPEPEQFEALAGPVRELLGT